MSGSGIAPWVFHTRDNIRNSSMYVANLLGCDNNTFYIEESDNEDNENVTTTMSPNIYDKEAYQQIVQCMKNTSAVDIVLSGNFVSSLIIQKMNVWITTINTIRL